MSIEPVCDFCNECTKFRCLTPVEASQCHYEKQKAQLSLSFNWLVSDAKREAERAITKYPQPNYVITKVAEEAGEVVKDAVHCAENRQSYDELKKEMTQLIAMLYRLWVEGDEVHGLKPVGLQ